MTPHGGGQRNLLVADNQTRWNMEAGPDTRRLLTSITSVNRSVYRRGTRMEAAPWAGVSRMPLFTLAIPTYNRAALLAEALQSARAQTFDDYEIVVRDNASTDGTAELVRSHGDPRLRYHRNAENVGWHRNFELLAEDARGEFLVYLQDDDLLHPDFLSRAAQAFRGRPGVALYAAYLACVPPRSSQSWAMTDRLWGPELPMAWDQCGPRYWPGPLASVQCLLHTPFVMPGVALHTDLCRKYMPWDRTLGLASDRLLTGCVAAEGLVAVDPWVGGFYRIHCGQATNRYGDYSALAALSAQKLLAFYEAKSVDWRALLREWLADLPPERHQVILEYAVSAPFPRELREVLASVLPGLHPLPRRSLPRLVKRYARDLTPPLLWRFARRLASAP